MSPRWLACAILIFAAVAAAPDRTAAHPHIWITNSTGVVVADGRMVAVRHRWSFDELFSAAIIGEFDLDRDGAFSEPELAALKAGAFDALEQSAWFTHVRIGGTPAASGTLQLGGVDGFTAEIADGRLIYSFTVTLAEPIVLRAEDEITIGVYDQSYYVDVAFAEADSVALVGDAPAGCVPQLIDDAENPIYFGMVVPKAVRLSCAGS